jgi:hypothetical protein
MSRANPPSLRRVFARFRLFSLPACPALDPRHFGPTAQHIILEMVLGENGRNK